MNYPKMAEALKEERTALWKEAGSPLWTPTGKEKAEERMSKSFMWAMWHGSYKGQVTCGLKGQFAVTLPEVA
jgi:hypothetical protein